MRLEMFDHVPVILEGGCVAVKIKTVEIGRRRGCPRISAETKGAFHEIAGGHSSGVPASPSPRDVAGFEQGTDFGHPEIFNLRQTGDA